MSDNKKKFSKSKSDDHPSSSSSVQDRQTAAEKFKAPETITADPSSLYNISTPQLVGEKIPSVSYVGDLCVEVRGSSDSCVWFLGKVLDIKKENKFLVKFNDNIQPSSWFDASCIRRSSNDSSEPGNTYPVGSFVEVFQQPGDSWTLAKVKAMKGGFYFVDLITKKISDNSSYSPYYPANTLSGLNTNSAHGNSTYQQYGMIANNASSQSIIVEGDSLRAVSSDPCFDKSPGILDLERSEIVLDEALNEWILSKEFSTILTQLRDKSGLFLISRAVGKIVLIGSNVAIRRATLLLSVHLRHQREIHVIQSRKAQRDAYIASRPSLEFYVDSRVIGCVIGKAGENLRKIEEKFKVDVWVQKESKSGSHSETIHSNGALIDPKLIRVSGDDAQSIQLAKAELDYVFKQLPVEANMVGWLLGKNMRNIQDVIETTGVVFARINQGILEICGLRERVEDAAALCESHMHYFGAYRDLDIRPNPVSKNRNQRDNNQNRSTDYPRRDARRTENVRNNVEKSSSSSEAVSTPEASNTKENTPQPGNRRLPEVDYVGTGKGVPPKIQGEDGKKKKRQNL